MKKYISLCALFTLVACANNVCEVEGAAGGAVGNESRVYFEFDQPNKSVRKTGSFNLDGQSQEKVREFANANPNAKIVLEGHTDRWGPEEYNFGLGEQRANVVEKELLNSGVAADRISKVSYGKSNQPVPNAATAEEDALNRVVVIRQQ